MKDLILNLSADGIRQTNAYALKGVGVCLADSIC